MSLIAASTEGAHHVRMARHPLGSNSPLALRARRLVQAMGFDTSAEFAEWLGVSATRWNNVERGYPLGGGLARILKQFIPGLSYEWLYHGNPDGLSVEMARKLGEIPDIPQPPPPVSRKRRARAARKAV